MAKILRTTTTTHIGPVGHCIYCGGQQGDLSDEHVIPLSLGGNYILDEASCRACSEITGKFEGQVTRGFMFEARVAANFPTRHRRKRPSHLPLKYRRADETVEVHVPAGEHPGMLHLPLLGRAGILAGRSHSPHLLVDGFETLRFGVDPVGTLLRLQAHELTMTVKWEVTAFARMLAKIAYCAAVASLGPLERSRVPILPMILGTADASSHWLGSADFNLEVEKEMPQHAIGFSIVSDDRNPDHKLLVAKIKLFCRSGATGYEIVVLQQS